MIHPPLTEEALLERAYQIAGKTIEMLAQLHHLPIPTQMHHAKGWIGQLLEKTLGANAQNLDKPDFMTLGIELKTIPISPQGKICESTYLCAVSLPFTELTWKQSRVWRKLAHILWIPIESSPEIPLRQRRVGTPLLWQPSLSLETQIREDWEELTELITLGHFDQLSAHKGKYLQIRPKAAHSKILTPVLDHHGDSILTVPKGFYLRSTLTQKIIDEHYATSLNHVK